MHNRLEKISRIVYYGFFKSQNGCNTLFKCRFIYKEILIYENYYILYFTNTILNGRPYPLNSCLH